MKFDRHRDKLLDLLNRCPAPGKVKANDGVLSTVTGIESAEGFENLVPVKQALEAGETLQKEQARAIVHFVDFLVVALPDNQSHFWDADLLKFASTLRQDFASEFGEKAYST